MKYLIPVRKQFVQIGTVEIEGNSQNDAVDNALEQLSAGSLNEDTPSIIWNEPTLIDYSFRIIDANHLPIHN